MKSVGTIVELFDELFTINFSHSGFDSLSESMISEHLRITPDRETAKLLKNFRMGLYFDNDVFGCHIQSKMENPPAASPRAAYIMPATGVLFRFLLKASNYFMTTTSIRSTAGGKAYYFSNRLNAGTGMFISHDAGEVNNLDLITVPDPKPDIRETFLGVIDIFSGGAINPNYELFSNATGRLRKPEYRLLFRSLI
jgi:hypothetical protein